MTPVKIRFSWITAQADGTEHAVTDEAQEAGRKTGKGRYEAVCGAMFLAAAMEAGPLRRCMSCEAFLRARRELRDFNERMNRPSWLYRLCRRHKQPADVDSETTILPPNAPTSAGTKPSAGAGSTPENTTASVSAPAGARHRRGRRHAA